MLSTEDCCSLSMGSELTCRVPGADDNGIANESFRMHPGDLHSFDVGLSAAPLSNSQTRPPQTPSLSAN